MLTEEEWTSVEPHLENAIEQIKDYRKTHRCSLAEASRKGFGEKALAQYRQLTGFDETNPNVLFHHRLSLYGPPCRECNKPLRTPEAKYCASCGAARNNGVDACES